MLLRVALLDAERNETASHPAASDGQDCTKNPSENSFRLSHLSHSASTAVMAVDDDRVVGPFILFVRLFALDT